MLTPTIALAAVGIGFAQWWTARNKLKLDLFDRRWVVYIAARTLLSEIFTQGQTTEEAEQKFIVGIRGARWLFDAQVETYLRNELWAKATLLRAANSMLEHLAPAEALALEWNEVDLTLGTLIVAKSKSTSPRTVHLFNSAIELLQSLPKPPNHAKASRGGFVFWHDEGLPYRQFGTSWSQSMILWPPGAAGRSLNATAAEHRQLLRHCYGS